VRIRDIPEMVRREGVLPAYESVTFHREVARQHRPNEVQFVAFGHPLFDSIVSYCTQAGQGFDGTTTAKTIQNADKKGEAGALFNFRLRCTDGRGSTAHEELCSVYVTESGTLDVAPQIPRFDSNDLKPPTLGKGHLRALAKLEDLHSVSWQSAVTHSKEVEDTVQERRLTAVEAMKHDLDRYASAREMKIQMQRSVIEERIRQYRLQPQLMPSGQDIRILGEEARLRDLDREITPAGSFET
jgi:hypothetical protein